MTQRERLGKYEIIEVLGKGAMGVVFKGFDPGIDRTVAIKTVRKELIEDDGRAGMALARFRNEARAAGRLSHPGIVSVFDYGESTDVTYIAMEFVQGNSLREYFNRGTRFAEPDIVSVMAQLLEALQHAHDAGVWHRDIKPANLIIMSTGRLKIADFGIARIESSQLTQTGVVMGSPGYMAPEQYTGSAIDWRADLFAAGVVMHQLLTGARLFTGTTEQLAYKICHVQPPLPSEVDPGKGWERYDAIVMKALEKNSDARYQSAAAFRDALLQAYAQPANAAVSEETIIAAPAGPAAVFEPSHPSVRTGERVPVRELPPLAPSASAAASGGPEPHVAASNRGKWLLVAGLAGAVAIGAIIGGVFVARDSAPEAAPAQHASSEAAADSTEATPSQATPATLPQSAAAPVAESAPVAQHEVPSAVVPRAHTAPPEKKAEKPKPAPRPRPRRAELAKAPLEPSPLGGSTAAPAPRPRTPARASSPRPAAKPPQQAAGAAPAPAKPPETSIWRDQGINMKVASKVQFNRRLWTYGIQVETVAGIVTLKGTVETKAESAEAEKLAAGVSGVLGVKNEIKVSQ